MEMALPSIPPNLWRGFENISNRPAWCFAVLEQHEVFESKDPQWAPSVIRKAKEHGFVAEEIGRIIKPHNFEEINDEMLEKMFNANCSIIQHHLTI